MKEPRWVVAFLRALERTGVARAAATDAGVDFSTAYARRRRHSDFAAAWESALRRRSGRAVADPSTIVPAGNGPPPRAELGEELAGVGGQGKRVSEERWGRRKRELYLAELAATANHRRAALAAGISYEAVRKRRKQDRRLEAACEAAIAECQALAPAYLASALVATFDPQSLPDDGGLNPLPRMTISEAIKVSQMSARAAPAGPDPVAAEAAAMTAAEVEALRARVLTKVRRLSERRDAEKIAAGWTLDEEHDVLVPPGWQKGAAP